MKRLGLDDILDLDRYEVVRPVYRGRVIAHKERRRVAAGERVTVVFEDRETVRYQIQEMTRIEQSRGQAKIQSELDAYNDLVPGDHELSATLFIEIPEMDHIRPELDRLVGIDEHVALVLGEDDDAESVRAEFDPNQMEEERISAVQYIHFPFSPGQIERFASGDRARLRIDHPNYRAEGEILSETRASLLRDLRSDPPVLLDPLDVPGIEPLQDTLLHESGGVRVLLPDRPQAPGHHVLELADSNATLLDVDTEAWLSLLAVLQPLAERIARESGPCRVWTEVDPPRPIRIHLSGRAT